VKAESRLSFAPCRYEKDWMDCDLSWLQTRPPMLGGSTNKLRDDIEEVIFEDCGEGVKGLSHRSRNLRQVRKVMWKK
jgi:hypothetical protein